MRGSESPSTPSAAEATDKVDIAPTSAVDAFFSGDSGSSDAGSADDDDDAAAAASGFPPFSTFCQRANAAGCVFFKTGFGAITGGVCFFSTCSISPVSASESFFDAAEATAAVAPTAAAAFSKLLPLLLDWFDI